MTIVAIANALRDGAMRESFHANPLIQASELLLQERMPRDIAVARPRAEEGKATPHVRELALPMLHRFQTPHDATPRTHLLSNGNYAVMLTAEGSGYSRRQDLAVTRCTLESAASPEDDAEVRRVSIANLGTRTREIELTSYAEIVLAPPSSDTSHPAFSKPFV